MNICSFSREKYSYTDVCGREWHRFTQSSGKSRIQAHTQHSRNPSAHAWHGGSAKPGSSGEYEAITFDDIVEQ